MTAPSADTLGCITCYWTMKDLHPLGPDIQIIFSLPCRSCNSHFSQVEVYWVGLIKQSYHLVYCGLLCEWTILTTCPFLCNLSMYFNYVFTRFQVVWTTIAYNMEIIHLGLHVLNPALVIHMQIWKLGMNPPGMLMWCVLGDFVVFFFFFFVFLLTTVINSKKIFKLQISCWLNLQKLLESPSLVSQMCFPVASVSCDFLWLRRVHTIFRALASEIF